MTNTLIRPTRRTLVRGAAWSVPVVSIAAAAPAFAASCSQEYQYALTWGSSAYTRNSATNGVATATTASAGQTGLTVTFSSTSTSGNVVDGARNLAIPPNTGTGTTQDPVVNNLGGRTGERGLAIYNATSTAGRSARQVVTISFSRPVRGLSFYLTDIDTITSPAYADRVELTSTPAISNGTGATNRVQTLDGITGIGGAPGAAADPWQRSADLNVGENNAGAQVRLQFPFTTNGTQDVSQLQLTYWNATGGTQYHRIYIGNMTFKAKGC